MLRPEINRNIDYSQTLTMKILLATVPFEGKYKRRDGGPSHIYLTFKQTLEVIKKIDHLTCQMPKVIYLVGWQFNGHDSKYPDWSEVNSSLKRDGDTNAVDSLRWLISEGRKYHTIVSLHLNMFDAYADSPLWDEYVAKDIIAKDRDGKIVPGEWGSPISYTQEWMTGMAQKRIDGLLEMLPELVDGGTIHIDAFHSWCPLSPKGPISPYLGYSIEKETETQRKLFRYWASKGVDVTSEGTDFLRITAFEGYQPMAWWSGQSIKNYMRWPANYYCGGVDRNPIRAQLFGTSMHGEPIVKDDSEKLEGFLEKFCLNVLPWQFLNRFDRLGYQNLLFMQSVKYSDNVESRLLGPKHSIKHQKRLLKRYGDLCIPLFWSESPTFIAFSKKGCVNKKWDLGPEWRKSKSLQCSNISLQGLTNDSKIFVRGGIISLSLDPGQAVLLHSL